jgi:hypothetical protein
LGWTLNTRAARLREERPAATRWPHVQYGTPGGLFGAGFLSQDTTNISGQAEAGDTFGLAYEGATIRRFQLTSPA